MILERKTVAKRTEIKFRIDAHTRETLPMARLAEYMAYLAELLGSREQVHFVRLEKGSVALVQSIEEEAVGPVRERVNLAQRPDAPEEIRRPFNKLNSLLRHDSAVGRLSVLDGAEILEFQGREMPEALNFGSVSKEGSLDGELLAIGGRSEQVPVHIGPYSACRATRAMAKEMAPHLFTPVRVFGTGRWARDDEGHWSLQHFTISHFDPLDPRSLSEALGEIRKMKDTSWVSRGLEEWRDVRGEEDD